MRKELRWHPKDLDVNIGKVGRLRGSDPQRQKLRSYLKHQTRISTLATGRCHFRFR